MAMKLQLEIAGKSYEVSVSADESAYTVELPSGKHTIDVRRSPSGRALSLLRDGESFEAWAVKNGHGYRIQVMGASFDVEVEDALRAKLRRLEAEAGGPKEFVVKAPMPGVVVELKVEEGASVEAGEPLVIVEAMKMRNEFSSKIAGVVSKIAVAAGQSVERNEVLCVVTPPEAEAAE